MPLQYLKVPICFVSQIELIIEEAEKIIQKVLDYREEVTNQVVTFDSELMAKKEDLEQLRTRIHKLNTDGHVTEKIRLNIQLTAKLAKSLDVDMVYEEPTYRPELITNGLYRNAP